MKISSTPELYAGRRARVVTDRPAPGGELAIDAGGDSDVCSEPRMRVGLVNHPATPNMATIALAAGPPLKPLSRLYGGCCPSDRLSAIADGAVPGLTREADESHGGSYSRGPATQLESRGARKVGAPSCRCEGRLPSAGRIKCGCARRDHGTGTSADAGSNPAASTRGQGQPRRLLPSRSNAHPRNLPAFRPQPRKEGPNGPRSNDRQARHRAR